MATAGVHHVGLSVRDVQVAGRFFCEALGLRVVGGRPGYPAVFVSDGVILITLWQVDDPAGVRDPDRRAQLGLHHLALQVASDSSLDVLYASLAARPDVHIEFPPEPLGTGGLRHMMLRGPSGLRLELVQ